LKLPLCFKSLKLPMFQKLEITYVSKAWNYLCFKSLKLPMFQKLDITYVSKGWYYICFKRLILHMFQKLDITYVSKAWNQMFQKLDITYVSKAWYYLCFKTAVHADNKWIVSKTHDISFCKNLFCLVTEDYILFTYLLHSKPLSTFFMSH
jgi:hypothetical protein